MLALFGAVAVAGGAPAHQSASSPALLARAAADVPSTDTVRTVQRALNVDVDGIYGPRTRAAVRAFQRREGLVVDGIAGPRTLRALGLQSEGGAAATQPRAAKPAKLDPRLARIARCESGGDPTAVSADGRYRGKYQFSRATWRALGGRGDPAAAPEAEQDRRAARLLARSGTAPWPSCA